MSFCYGGYRLPELFNDTDQAGPYTVRDYKHWLLEGTYLRQGNNLGDFDNIVHYECDGCDFTIDPIEGTATPTHADGTPAGFQIVASAPAYLSLIPQGASGRAPGGPNGWVADAVGHEVSNGAAILGTYTRGGTVVTTGCSDWVRGLRGNDPVVERITKNILNRLSGVVAKPETRLILYQPQTGDGANTSCRVRAIGAFPARAGMNRVVRFPEPSERSVPRTRGDEPGAGSVVFDPE